MRILVAFYSETGNTEKVAEAIYAVASIDHEAELRKIKDISIDELTDFDLLVFGSACHDSDLARPFKRLLDNLPQNPRFKLAGFFTHATHMPDETARRAELFTKWAGKCVPTFERICQEKEIQFLGYFHCLGTPSPPIEAFIHREIIISDEEWKEYLPEIKSRPNSKDLENAKAFTKKIINK